MYDYDISDSYVLITGLHTPQDGRAIKYTYFAKYGRPEEECGLGGWPSLYDYDGYFVF